MGFLIQKEKLKTKYLKNVKIGIIKSKSTQINSIEKKNYNFPIPKDVIVIIECKSGKKLNEEPIQIKHDYFLIINIK